jgi:hypothetical protein
MSDQLPALLNVASGATPDARIVSELDPDTTLMRGWLVAPPLAGGRDREKCENSTVKTT